MPIEPLTPADLFDLLPQEVQAGYALVDGQVYDRGDCAECCWCGTVEPVAWLKPLVDGYVCEDCQEEHRHETAGDYTHVMGRVL